MKRLRLTSLLFVFLLLYSVPTWADFQTGEDAYVNGDFQTAFEQWQPLATQGHAESQNMMGYMYRYGQGVVQDYAQALHWYRLSADQGNARAQNNLGVMYRLGLGTPQDYQEAFRWFHRAAEQGNGGGQNHLGLMYFKGEGIQQDFVQAYMWATLAADQGLDQATQALQILEHEMTPAQIEKSKRLAKEWKSKGKETTL
jgi:TPR repeat protein